MITLAEEAPEKLGRYEIVRAVGKGAMGVVYEGRDPMIGRRVAIKTCRRDVMEASSLRAEMLQRFDRELRAAGALQHPGIVTIFDVGEDQDTPYIAMEFIEGGDLRQMIEGRAGFSIAEMVEKTALVCEALCHAHRNGVIHRDVKPANVLLPASGGVKVADFGIARTLDSQLTLDGAIVGTPHYMSPEQFTGEPLDGRSDLFSVGIILYELLTGEKPFAGDALSTVMHHVLKREPAPPSTLNPDVPKSLDAVVLKSLAKRADDRYADGIVMAAALREALAVAPRQEVLDGEAPRKAPTVLGATKPPPPEPQPEFPLAQSHDPTLSPRERSASASAFSEDHTSTVLWPALAVGLFAALAIVALGLRMQVGVAPGAAKAPAAVPITPAATENVMVDVWGVDSAAAREKIAGAADSGEINAIRRTLDEATRVQIKAIGAKITVRDPATGQQLSSQKIAAGGGPVPMPAGQNSAALEAASEGFQTETAEVRREANGKWALRPVILLKDGATP
jgi:serine/threonine protein kinase